MSVRHILHNGGLAGLASRARALGRRVNVGFPSHLKAKRKKQSKSGKSYTLVDSDTPLAAVAAANNFGVPPHIPERPFMEAGIEIAKRRLIAINKRNVKKVLKGEMLVGNALAEIGIEAASGIKKAIDRSKSLFAPNAPSTIAKKSYPGHRNNQPLVDTHTMRDAVTWWFKR